MHYSEDVGVGLCFGDVGLHAHLEVLHHVAHVLIEHQLQLGVVLGVDLPEQLPYRVVLYLLLLSNDNYTAIFSKSCCFMLISFSCRLKIWFSPWFSSCHKTHPISYVCCCSTPSSLTSSSETLLPPSFAPGSSGSPGWAASTMLLPPARCP